ncbi:MULTISPECIES: hypothetical protein [unclassified Crossiella]|uniref:hypothetical protein n=1 Tax=unclassified Crossiella TaxID=2620835 RepID=UPI001FFE9F05|nr:MULTISPECIES: hypothetical protein [unclassified Crossiella]MCK2240930.1 hypothetical protein [Crossiella sp. S99.2]MCK2253926.1 hypothetical protein [Crossiella sp. S99.1]
MEELIVCARCKAGWDIAYLRNQSVSHLKINADSVIRQLDIIEDSRPNSSDRTVSQAGRVYPWSTSLTPITDAFRYWWLCDYANEDEVAQAAARLVQDAAYQATCEGKGCLDCGFTP